jgi:GTP-binding protein EngB required for normal cell division
MDVRVPQLVVFGSQNAGKSSFLEALLGFRFNYVVSGTGTRRPLLIQMSRKEGVTAPEIYFTDNDGNTDKNKTPPEACEDRIKDLTNDQLAREQKNVKEGFSSKLIVMSVQYQHCSNISVIDTPGLRPNDKNCREEIEKIVIQYLNKDSIPIYIQNSGQEWSVSHLSDEAGFLRKWDTDLSKTIVCISKFDERLNSSFDKTGLISFMIAEDPTVKSLRPILGYNYVSIGVPTKSNGVQSTLKDDMERAALQDIDKLLRAGFSAEEIGKYKYGIYPFISKLEQFLFNKIRSYLSPAHLTIKNILDTKRKENNLLHQRIGKFLDPSSLQSLLSNLVSKIGRLFEEQLNGSTRAWEKFGRTLKEDFDDSLSASWFQSNNHSELLVDKDSKYIGGSAINRSLEWMKIHCVLLEFPDIKDGDVKNALAGIGANQNAPIAEIAAAKILVEKGKGIAEAIAAHHDLVLCILSRTVDAVIDLVMEEEPLVTALQASLRSVLVPFLNNVMVRYKANLTEVFDFLTAFGVLSSADYQFPIMKPSDPKGDPDKNKLVEAVLGVNKKSMLSEFLQTSSVRHPTQKDIDTIKRGVVVMFHYLKLKFAGLIEYKIGQLRRELYV